MPVPKYGKTDQTTLPAPACAWKRSSLKEEEIKVLEAAKLLQNQDIISWIFAYNNPWPLEEHANEMVIFAHFIERGLVLPGSYFFGVC